ncbi:MAG: hypothetical protein ACYC56_09095, partial [Candidatus Aquicultor sp.]
MKKVIAAAAIFVVLVLLLVGYFVFAPSRTIKEKTPPTTVWSLKLDGEVAKDWTASGIRASAPRTKSKITGEQAIQAAKRLGPGKTRDINAYYARITGNDGLEGDYWIIAFKGVNGMEGHPVAYDAQIPPDGKHRKAPVDDGIVRFKNLYRVVSPQNGKAVAAFAPG